ncbi:MAG: DUF434 domain-containing protein [Defluviitaleaceae bacterium]|nr:DUF434 domain-containing protein [Defluviitaleaceae bacterium]
MIDNENNENKKPTLRGYVPTDKKQFSEKQIPILKKAQLEIQWLLDKDYPIKNAIKFVCDHYMISTRQRLALLRATAPTLAIKERKNKQATNLENKTLHIDGFNLIITLEVALSGSPIIKSMDCAVRDLAEIRGTYRLIDKTDIAIDLIANKLKSMKVYSVVFYLDEQVSNTGRLKAKILERLQNLKVSVEIIKNVDKVLKNKDYVVTSDAMIINECTSWVNLANDIISESINNVYYIDLG